MHIRFIESDDEMPKLKKIKKGEESWGDDDGTTVISGADLKLSNDEEFVDSVSGAYLKSSDDKEFVDAYRRSKPCCLVIPQFCDGYIKDIYCVPIGDSLSVFRFNLSDKPREKPSVKPTEQDRIYDYTDIIDGIFCYYSKNSVFLANIFTHEIVELPPITIPSLYVTSYPRYYLGFDPVGRVYKLLCKRNRWIPSPKGWTNSCRIDILTLGRDFSWRNLDGDGYTVLPFLITGQTICINGVLYWLHRKRDGFLDTDSGLYSEFKLYSFDLMEEKFVKIFTPIFMRDRNVLELGCFLQFKGRLTLCACGPNKMVLYIVRKDNKRWKRKVFVLPCGFWAEGYLNYASILAGNMSNGDIFLLNHGDETSVYSYICKTDSNTFERCVIGKWPWTFAKNLGGRKALHRIACLEQNVATLDALNLGVYKTSYSTTRFVEETEEYLDYLKPPKPFFETRSLMRFDAITPRILRQLPPFPFIRPCRFLDS